MLLKKPLLFVTTLFIGSIFISSVQAMDLDKIVEDMDSSYSKSKNRKRKHIAGDESAPKKQRMDPLLPNPPVLREEGKKKDIPLSQEVDKNQSKNYPAGYFYSAKGRKMPKEYLENKHFLFVEENFCKMSLQKQQECILMDVLNPKFKTWRDVANKNKISDSILMCLRKSFKYNNVCIMSLREKLKKEIQEANKTPEDYVSDLCKRVNNS